MPIPASPTTFTIAPAPATTLAMQFRMRASSCSRPTIAEAIMRSAPANRGRWTRSRTDMTSYAETAACFPLRLKRAVLRNSKCGRVWRYVCGPT